YSQNANGRMVYLPTDAIEVRMKSGRDYRLTNLPKGDNYIKVDLDEVVFFILDGGILPLAKIVEVDKIRNIESVDYNDLEFIGNIYNKKEYILYYEEDTIKEKKIKLN
ncbi:MAG: alpha-glucosidase, partial [Bacilli bacterium]|nr:alpha-glucosidase [Bacilli bacterium]